MLGCSQVWSGVLWETLFPRLGHHNLQVDVVVRQCLAGNVAVVTVAVDVGTVAVAAGTVVAEIAATAGAALPQSSGPG